MIKEFLNVEQIRDNGLSLAKKIYEDGFIPSVIYVALRGGSTLGNVISEYFKLISYNDPPPLFAAVVAHSYEELSSSKKVYIDGWTYEPKFLRKYDKVLFIDDIFDSGLTINVIVDALLEQGVNKENLKIAVHDFKIRSYVENTLNHYPHYYCRKHEITSPEKDNWIHYLSHELAGLSEEELRTHYGTEIRPIIRSLLQSKKSL